MAAKVMLVEDDINLSEIYQARLEAEGFEIISAKDGEEALALAVKEHPDLIISDVMMPKISGFDMLDILRGTEGVQNTKVIMMTALGQSEDKLRAEKLGADRYLVKSQVTLEDVVKVVHEVLDGFPAVPAGGTSPDPITQTTPTPTVPTPPVAPPPPPVAPPPAEPVVVPVPVAPPAPAVEAAPAIVAPITTLEPVAPETPPELTAPTPTTIAPVEPSSEPSEPATILKPDPRPEDKPIEETKPEDDATESSNEPESEDKPSTAEVSIDASGNITSEAIEKVDSAKSTPVEEEQTAVLSQIQDFVNKQEAGSKPDSSSPTPTTAPEPAPTSNLKSVSSAVPPVIPDQDDEDKPSTGPGSVPIAHKKVISPINDGSSRPDIHTLLAQEENKPKVVPGTGPLIRDVSAPNLVKSPEENEESAGSAGTQDGFDPNSIAL